MPRAPRRSTKLDVKPVVTNSFMKSTQALSNHEAWLMRELQQRLHAKVEGELRKRSIYLSFPLARALHVVSAEPGMSGAQLARRCSVAAQSMNGLLVALEKAGYVERKPDRENARVLRCYAMPAGVAVMQQTMSVAFAVFDSILNVLTARDRVALKRMLRALIEAIAVDGNERASVPSPYASKTADSRISRTSKRKRVG